LISFASTCQSRVIVDTTIDSVKQGRFTNEHIGDYGSKLLMDIGTDAFIGGLTLEIMNTKAGKAISSKVSSVDVGLVEKVLKKQTFLN